MNPNSLGYISFLTAAVLLHRMLRPQWRSRFLMVISWLFYLICTPKFFVLFFVTALTSYGIAIAMERSETKLRWLLLGLGIDLGILFLFKYLGFCASLVFALLGLFGMTAPELPAFVQPLGISFYTFAITGYLFDVYRGNEKAERCFWDFSLFVGFFPAVLSGPIARAKYLLPQVKNHAQTTLTAEQCKSGLTRIFIGLAKKMLLADQLAIVVNQVYADLPSYSGKQILVAAMAYSIQIYCDFSAYSDMAVGAGQLFGIQLTENFEAPYLAASIKDFWKRWHISLTSWFRDYLYFPLGGSRRGKTRTYINILIVFAVSGLWHGAGMSFLVWGLLNGLYQVIEQLLAPVGKRLRQPLRLEKDSRLLYPFKVVITFLLATAAWIFFRADTVWQALEILKCICINPGGLFPLYDLGLSIAQWKVTLLALFCLFLWDWLGRKYALAERLNRTVWLRYIIWSLLLLAVLCFGAYGSGYDAQEFVYFKF